jgi:hypothetical protein
MPFNNFGFSIAARISKGGQTMTAPFLIVRNVRNLSRALHAKTPGPLQRFFDARLWSSKYF